MVDASEVVRLRTATDAIARTVVEDLTAFLRKLGYASDPIMARDAMIYYAQQLVQDRGTIAAQAAADWFDVNRSRFGATRTFTATLRVPTDTPVKIDATIRRALNYVLTDTPSEADFERAVVSHAEQYTRDAATNTIRANSLEDPDSRGWIRDPNPGACDFCLMQAGRGAVYTRATAGFKSHTGCSCVAVPVWD